MPINLELGKFIPERFKRTIEPESYEFYIVALKAFNAKDVYALPVTSVGRRTPEEKEEHVLKFRLSVDFTSLSESKRKIKYRHECSEIRTSDPQARDTRSIMVPDPDIRMGVWERIEDARARTFLSGLYMLRDVGRKIPQIRTHLMDKQGTFSEEDIKELLDHAGLRGLKPWPNTPGFEG